MGAIGTEAGVAIRLPDWDSTIAAEAIARIKLKMSLCMFTGKLRFDFREVICMLCANRKPVNERTVNLMDVEETRCLSFVRVIRVIRGSTVASPSRSNPRIHTN